MESWKNLGIFLTGFAAVITAVSTMISYLNENPSAKFTPNPVQILSKSSTPPPVVLASINDPEGWVNLRTGPSINSKVLSTLENGDKVEVLNKENNWVKVKTKNNVGYIYFDRLEMIYNDHVIPK